MSTLGSISLRAFAPALVGAWMRDHPDELHRSMRGTMVFTDLSGFTAMSERLGALGAEGTEELVAQLDDVFRRQLDLAASFGGQLLKFGGDALLVWFDGDGHERRAARACVELQELLARIGTRRTPAGTIEVSMTVGANTGDFDFLLVGDAHRELLVVGEAASKTVDTEETAASGEVRVSAELAACLPASCLGDTNERGGVLLLSGPDVEPTFERADPWGDVDPAHFLASALRAEIAGSDEIAEHRQFVLAFIHLASVDQLLERVGGTAAAATTHAAVAILQSVLAEHDLTFVSSDVYQGGPKVIATAGAPTAHEDDDERMLTVLRTVVDRVAAEVPEVGLRIGVNRGRGFWGLIGSDDQRRVVTMGDVVNTAARVMAKAAPGEILTTAPTLDRSDVLFQVEQLEPFAAKGKTKPLTTYRVGRPIGRRPTVVDTSAPFIGRATELDTIRRSINGLTDGRGFALEVIGPGGLGKSRLVDEAVRDSGIEVVRAAGGIHAVNTPYFPFRRLLRALFGGRDATTIGQVVRRHAPDLEPWIPLLARAAGLEMSSTREVNALADAAVAPKVASTIAAYLEAVGTPLIWAIDDTHLLDESSVAVLDALAGMAGSVPLGMIATSRAQARDRWESIEVSPLDDRDLGELIRFSIGRPVRPDDLAGLVAKASGNAQFALEMGRSIRDGAGVDELPETVEATIAARIDRLETRERKAVRDLSVLGRTSSAELARAVVGRAAFELGPDAQSFVQIVDDEVRFSHTIVREVAYEELGFSRRRALHRRAGEWLEATQDHDEVIELLSFHFWAARDAARGVTYSRAAGKRARLRLAMVDAGALYGRAVELLPRVRGMSTAERGQLWAEYAQCVRHADHDLAKDAFRRARRMLRGHAHDLASVALGEAILAIESGDYRLARAATKRGIGHLGTLPTPDLELRARLRTCEGRLREIGGDRSGAVERYHDARELARRADSAGAYANATNLLVIICPDDPEPYAREALDLFRSADSPLDVATTLNNLATRHVDSGRWSEAVELMQQATLLLDEAGAAQSAAIVRCNAAELLLNQGRFDDGARTAAEAHEVLDALGSWLVSFAGALGAAAEALGDVDSDLASMVTAAEAVAAAGWAAATGIVWRFVGLVALSHRLPELEQLARSHLADAGAVDTIATLRGLGDEVCGDAEVVEATDAADRLWLAAAADPDDPQVRLDVERLGVVDFPPVPALAVARQRLFGIAGPT